MSTAIEPSLFVGIDRADRAHEVCAPDGSCCRRFPAG
jgi:hypothetical protein